jgi:hypothetical protein
MGIIPGFLGLTLAFLLIAVVLLWFFIKAKVPVLLKLIVIPLVIWYSLVLLYTPNKLLGWPSPEEWPEGAMVLKFIIVEPSPNKPGGFYFWLIDDGYMKRQELLKIGKIAQSETPGLLEVLNPKDIFGYKSTNTPRAYIMPYDREFHKMLTKKDKKKKGMRGRGVMRLFRKMLKGENKNKHKRPGKLMPHEKYDIKIEDKSLSLRKLPLPHKTN